MESETFEHQITAVLERGRDLWPSLEGASIFMTGGTGFFGRWLLETLARVHDELGVDFSLLALSRDETRFLAGSPRVAACPAIAFHRGDIRDFTFPDRPFTHVFHGAATAAAATFHKTEDPLTKFATSFDGTRRTLELAVRSGAGKFLMVGSGSVYGGMPGTPDFLIPEDHPGRPSPLDMVAAMGHGKHASEFLCAAYGERHGLDYTIARCFTFIGAHLPLDIHYAIGNFIADALWGEGITIRGDGLPRRSYLHAGDLVLWLTTMLLKPGPRRIYNVGSDEALTLAALAHRVRDVIAPDKPVHILGQGASGAGNGYVPSIDRARRDFGLDVMTPLDEAIRLAAAAERHLAANR